MNHNLYIVGIIVVLEINEAFTTVLMVTDENGNPASGKTVSYRLFDEALNIQESGSMIELGVYGIYYKSWTPDAAGYWIFEAYYTGADFKFYDIKMYPVEKGSEADIDAIKAKTDLIPVGGIAEQATLINATYGLSALKTLIDLKASQLSVDEIGGDTDYIINGIDDIHDTDLPAIKSKTDLIVSGGATEVNVDAVETKVDTLTTDVGRKVVHQDFWSASVAAVAITDAESNINLPNVVVAGLPAGATITRVEVLFKCRLIRDSSTADNAVHDLDADFFISVDADPARASKVNAIAILEDFWSVDVSTSPDTGGDVIVGSTDVKAEVTIDGTYYLTMDNAQSDGNNLNLLDVMIGLRVYFY